MLGRVRRYPYLTLVTLLSFLFLVGLGTWQVYRLEWKRALIADIEAKFSKDPVDIQEIIKSRNPVEFTLVRAKGRFLHDKELHQEAKYFQNVLGLYLITPFKLDSGSIVLVNRGWVPKEKRDPDSRPDTLVQGNTEIVGFLHASEKKRLFLPDNDPPENFWFRLDIDAMAEYLTLDKVFPMAIQEVGEGQGVLKRPGKQIPRRNDHLFYAITWYALAAALIGVYLNYIRQK